MKKLLIIPLLILSLVSFGQTKKEKISGYAVMALFGATFIMVNEGIAMRGGYQTPAPVRLFGSGIIVGAYYGMVKNSKRNKLETPIWE